MKYIRCIHSFFRKHYFTYSMLVMVLATSIAWLFFYFGRQTTTSIVLIYILALLLISYGTEGYRYGLGSAAVAVLCMNFLFTDSFFALNFTPSGPITFIGMFAISIIASATVTNLRRQTKQLALQERKLAEAEKEKMRANLLRAVSHDLRTPLTGIIGSSSAYLSNADFYSEEDKQNLVKNIHDDANWLLEMVENLLSVTRIQNDCKQLKTNPEVVDEVVAEAVTTLKKRHPDAQISVTIPDEILLIPMDAMLIEQVIINFLENGLTHGKSEKPLLLTVENEPDKVLFRVKDFGSGISKDRLDTIFEATGESLPAVDGYTGMGIGLSICKTIITAHNGTIGARNHGSGAEFYFTLPKEEHHEP